MDAFATVCVFAAFICAVIGAVATGIIVLSAVLDDEGETVHVLLALAFPVLCALAVGLAHASELFTGVK